MILRDSRLRRILRAGGLLLIAASAAVASAPDGKVSRFGEYAGWSDKAYDSWVRSSRYLAMPDGVRLALDVLRPARNGQVETRPLPVIFTFTRYRRAGVRPDGTLVTAAESPLTRALLEHGYVCAVADVRGSGASFGSWTGIFTPQESRDAREIVEWLARQPWCDGGVGMAGGSYLGATQLLAAAARPPHLKAIFPMAAPFDIYEVGSHGGVLYDDLVKHWSDLTRYLDTAAGAAPVDGDADGRLLKQALAQHASNRALIDIMRPLRFRNSRDESTGAAPFAEWHPAAYLREISASGIPMYLWGGWFDSFTRDQFLMFRNFDVPRRLVIGAWSHSPRDPAVVEAESGAAAVEQRRWFDYWLKGIDNGILLEPPIRYEVMIGPGEGRWRTADSWPVPEYREFRFYLQAGPSESVASVNDGLLGRGEPSGRKARDVYAADPACTTGPASRWDNAVGGGFEYPDMTTNDCRGLTYTTPLLEEDLEVVGHPVLRLWVTPDREDADIFAYLEEVDGAGVSHYVTEGAVRVSHRALHDPPYDAFGLPFRRSFRQDVRPAPQGVPVSLVFDLQPTAAVFNAGHRLRLTLTCADSDNAERRPSLPVITVHREAGRASHLAIPVSRYPQPLENGGDDGALIIILVVLALVILILSFTFFARGRKGGGRGGPR